MIHRKYLFVNEKNIFSVENRTCLCCNAVQRYGGGIITDGPYCDKPTALPAQLSGGLKTDAVIPFRTSKDDSKNAFHWLCKGETVFPKEYTSKQWLENISGTYVPSIPPAIWQSNMMYLLEQVKTASDNVRINL